MLKPKAKKKEEVIHSTEVEHNKLFNIKTIENILQKYGRKTR